MIRMEPIEGNIFRIAIDGKVYEGDFERFLPQLDQTIRQKNILRILGDGTLFKGWANGRAFREHINFAKSRAQYVDKLAIVPGHFWQYGMILIVRSFIHGRIKLFRPKQYEAAMTWLREA